MTILDTSVIIDARTPGSEFHDWAREQIFENIEDGVIVNTIALAEASIQASNKDEIVEDLESFGLQLRSLPVSAAKPAAIAYAAYLSRLRAEGKTGKSKIPLGDFFIGAHAAAENLKLITRDPKRIKTYFPQVEITSP